VDDSIGGDCWKLKYFFRLPTVAAQKVKNENFFPK
jgi:hypothetical protein